MHTKASPPFTLITEGGGGFVTPSHINRLLRCSFTVMASLGEWVLRPFLQVRWQGIVSLFVWRRLGTGCPGQSCRCIVLGNHES